ncbi:hypothetical protein [Cognatishimia sp. MH4019]|uniref:hypothetical protein n=1 Tax=Cognatishimia sp. MH4019 TaxID=2854030 RepID=UPI001CD4667C|nr:hypothetical protein [Cognatishimia sp. MH4019]
MSDPRALADGEHLIAEFPADRATYLRDHSVMAAIAMGGAMLVLWWMGNPHIWTGAVAGLAAIAIRGWYLQSEELSVTWLLTDSRLLGPPGRTVMLRDITKVRGLGSAVQVVTEKGDKHLIKYQADKDAVIARLRAASGAPE